MRLNNPARAFLALVLALMLIAGPAACKKKDEQGKSPEQTAEKVKQPQEIDLTASVASHIPQDSFGFMLIDAVSPGYSRLLNSPWSGSSLSAETLAASKELAALDQTLKGAGIDVSNKASTAKTFSHTALFIAPGPEKAPIFGGVVTSDAEDLNAKLQSVKKELPAKSNTIQIEDLSGPTGTLVKVTVEVEKQQSQANIGEEPVLPAAPVKEKVSFFLAAEGKTASFSNDQSTAVKVLKPSTAPAAILTAEDFKKGATGLADKESRFVTGYLDLNAPFIKSAMAAQDEAQLVPAKDLPLKGLILGMSMKDSPESVLRVLYKQEQDPARDWQRMLAASKGENVARTLPQNLLLFLSVDGQTVRNIRNATLGENTSNVPPDVMQSLAFIDSLGRIGAAARVAPVGQSFLPIPDVMLVMDSSDSSKVVGSIKKAVDTWAASSGLPVEWKTKDVNGKTVEYVMTPLNVGVFMAKLDNIVLASSTESFLAEALKEASNAGPKALSQAFTRSQQDETVANIYVNFNELATLAQNMSGVLAAYAPQEQAGKQFMTQQRIDELKKLGVFVGSAKTSADMLELTGRYESLPSAKQPG